MEIKGKLRKTGSSLGIVVPKVIADALGLGVGSEVTICVDDQPAARKTRKG